jgi:polyphenol oxidase
MISASATAEYRGMPLPGKDAPAAFLSTKTAGSMRYLPGVQNGVRDRWLRTRGFNPDQVLCLPLIHSRRVYKASTQQDLAGLEGDGIITSNPAACAVLTVADCMPIYLYDPDSGAFGILHSGWKGTGILAEAFRLMAVEYGTRAARLCVALGPRVGVCCYPVDEERALIFSNEFGAASVVTMDGTPRLDLVAANMSIAERLGINCVSVVDACTACDENLGSYRREGVENFTRMAAAIGYTSTAAGG